MSAFLATHVTVGGLLAFALAWLAVRLVWVLGGALTDGQHSDDGGATRRRIEAQDAALRAQAAQDREAER